MTHEYQKELSLLCDTFERSHVRAAVAEYSEPLESVMDVELSSLLGGAPPKDATVGDFLKGARPKTVYLYQDAFCFHYVYIPLGGFQRPTALFLGPYLAAPVLRRDLLAEGERRGLSPRDQRYLAEYCDDTTVVGAESPLWAMLEVFCERLFGTRSYDTVETKEEETASPIAASQKDDGDDTLVKMLAMEKRYAFENEMIDAVKHGQTYKEKRMTAAFSEASFEKRALDPLRNAKNYGVIMNTLLRKAAEDGGVHPVHIDSLSSRFAQKIEHMSSLAENTALMCEMFRSYCRLVRKHTMKGYSPIVQKTMLLIESDLSEGHHLASIAASQSISAGYLSAVFKRETGRTVSEYIRQKRVEHAAHLLATTHLQVQTVALHCGIEDVQYFSKIFKKEMGKTPKEYRESFKK